MPCARLIWPFCQLLSARKCIVSYNYTNMTDFGNFWGSSTHPWIDLGQIWYTRVDPRSTTTC